MSIPRSYPGTERSAFIKAYPHLDFTEVPDAWGRPMFKHPHVQSLWDGWFARAVLSSDGGVEVRHAETGNMPGSVPGEEVSSAATSFERPTVQGAAIQPCAGVTTGPSDDYVLMPREATRTMTMAGCNSLPSCEHVFGHAGEMLRNAYAKMVKTAALRAPAQGAQEQLAEAGKAAISIRNELDRTRVERDSWKTQFESASAAASKYSKFWEKHQRDFDQFGNYIPYSQMDGDLRAAKRRIAELEAASSLPIDSCGSGK